MKRGAALAGRWTGLGLLTFCLGACTSYASYRFAPPLQDVELRSADGTSSVARVLVSSRGIDEQKSEGHKSYALRFRLRVENRSATALTLAPEEFQLVDARLAAIGPVQIEPELRVIEGAAPATFELSFPFPPGKDPDDFDLSALSLRIALRSGQELWTWSASFQLVPYDGYYDPYWGPRWNVGVGFVISC